MKIKKLLFTTTVGISISMLLYSCENLIETDFPPTQINVSQVFETVSTADGALSNLYADLQYYSVISGGTSGTGALLGTYTDDLTCYIASSQNGALDIFNNQQLSTNNDIKNVWTNAYKEIYSANSIIKGVENSSGISTTDKNRIKGEALLIRSLVYFYLCQIYGAAPFVTTTDYTVNQSLGKISEAEMLTQIQNDLVVAVTLLEDSYNNAERIYPNKKAAQMVLAAVLMQQRKWAEGEQQLKTILQSPLYTWEPDISKTFKKTGKHIIWQLKPLQANEPTEEAFTYYFAAAAPMSYGLSANLMQSFLPSDLRRQQWIKEITINQQVYYRCDKYKNINDNTDEYSIVFRLEEVYLLLAEALAQQKKDGEAIPYINMIRQKAGNTPLNSLSNEDLLKEIIEENRREFFTEKGNRFITLKRNKKMNILNGVKPNWQTFHEVWPLPLSEIMLNPNLNPQNTGY